MNRVVSINRTFSTLSHQTCRRFHVSVPTLNKDYYKILGVSRNSSDEDIKKSFRKLAMKNHPDKHTGDSRKEAEEKFKEITQAYEVLSDPQKRQGYDLYGEEGVGQHDHSSQHAEDIFNMFFGGGGRQVRRQNQDVLQQVQFTLEDAYKGTTKTISTTVNTSCSTCNGTGSMKKDGHKTCSMCGGMKFVQVRPGFLQECPGCKGQGTTIDPQHRCIKCHGKKTVPSVNSLQVDIKRGAENGDRILYEGKGDHSDSSLPPGRLFVEMVQASHPLFTRKGDDLVMTKSIDMKESICGASVSFKHLDGRQVDLVSPKGVVIKDQSVLEVEGLGMPLEDRPKRFGKLFIQFTVRDCTLTSEQLDGMKQIFGVVDREAKEGQIEMKPRKETRRKEERTSDGGGNGCKVQ
ncbi:DnaJ [Acrasis kona]|uniref:DnaJ n=1 Tax=Acrasis kona TaxID=1008807 RepID=A0AAW2ZH04_9EUKA